MKNLVNKLACVYLLLFVSACNSGANKSNNETLSSSSKSVLIQNGTPVFDPRLNRSVVLLYNFDTYDMCSGTLLSSNKVVTAAHCVMRLTSKGAGRNYNLNNVSSPESIALFMASDPSTPLDINNFDNASYYSIQRVYVYRDAFRGATVSGNGNNVNVANPADLNDLAILILTSPVNGDYTYPDIAVTNPVINQREIIAGYGLDIGNNMDTDPDLGDSGLLRSAISYVKGFVGYADQLILVGGMDGNNYTRICAGDSGGPDFIERNGRLTITGIHSLELGFCGINKPGVSMSVAKYAPWIKAGYSMYHI